MATNPATLLDIADRWRPLTDDEATVAVAVLGDAWALLKHRIPTLEARLDAVPATLDAGLVRIVLVAMVLRVLRNPNGIRQESIQDYSYSRDAEGASGLLSVSEAELDLLVPSGTESGAFTIRPASQIPVGSSSYVSTDWEWRP